MHLEGTVDITLGVPSSLNLNGISRTLPSKHVGGFEGSTNDVGGAASPNEHTETASYPTLLQRYLEAFREVRDYRNGHPVTVDGHTLSVAAVVAAARYSARVRLDESPVLKERVEKSRNVIVRKADAGMSIYGVSTGYGGSADTRTNDTLALGSALLQHQHIGILPSSTTPLDVLPILDPLASTSMPESWVRGAILIRMNSLIRGHSGVRWKLIEKMGELLRENITPMIPMRGSISASGDLSPLSYIAGTLVGNPSIRVFDGPSVFGARNIVPSSQALADHHVQPLSLQSKEHLGILNGTAFSASVASLALHDAVHLALLAQVCTAMGTEALVGVRGSFAPFIHDVARPHPGQVEVAGNIWNLLEGSTLAVPYDEVEGEGERNISEDHGLLRQDRYPLRTAPQFLGPQIEDILSALNTVTQECNSTTDNPLLDGETGHVHHGGNFQAMAVTNAMEKTRLALHHIGKLLFSQSTELLNPTMNRGLPPSLAATDPSLNYHLKGVDIATAAYVSELGYLASPVSTHIQSAEMHNQAVNSLALISARATINSLEVLTMLTASYLYILCQALDLRALQLDLLEGLDKIVREELDRTFGFALSSHQLVSLACEVSSAMSNALESTSAMDAAERMEKVASSSMETLVKFFTGSGFTDISRTVAGTLLTSIPTFCAAVASRGYTLIDKLRREYLFGAKGPAPASVHLRRTRPVYEFVRVGLGVSMHGSENYERFESGGAVGEVNNTGQDISLIYEAIRDGKIQEVVAGLFEG